MNLIKLNNSTTIEIYIDCQLEDVEITALSLDEFIQQVITIYGEYRYSQLISQDVHVKDDYISFDCTFNMIPELIFEKYLLDENYDMYGFYYTDEVKDLFQIDETILPKLLEKFGSELNSEHIVKYVRENCDYIPKGCEYDVIKSRYSEYGVHDTYDTYCFVTDNFDEYIEWYLKDYKELNCGYLNEDYDI